MTVWLVYCLNPHSLRIAVLFDQSPWPCHSLLRQSHCDPYTYLHVLIRMCVCSREYLQNYTSNLRLNSMLVNNGRGSVFFWRRYIVWAYFQYYGRRHACTWWARVDDVKKRIVKVVSALDQRWTWVGSIHGLYWVGLNEKYCGIVAEYCKTHTFHCP